MVTVSLLGLMCYFDEKSLRNYLDLKEWPICCTVVRTSSFSLWSEAFPCLPRSFPSHWGEDGSDQSKVQESPRHTTNGRIWQEAWRCVTKKKQWDVWWSSWQTVRLCKQYANILKHPRIKTTPLCDLVIAEGWGSETSRASSSVILHRGWGREISLGHAWHWSKDGSKV